MKGFSGSISNLPKTHFPLQTSSNGASPAVILTNPCRRIEFLFCPSTNSQSPPMLKLLSSSSSRVHCLTAATPSFRVKPDSNSVFHALGRFTGLNRRSPTNSVFRACFCSDSSDGSGSQPVVEVEVKGAESESNGSDSKASSAIVSTSPRPEDYLTVSFGNYESFCCGSLFSC